MAGMTQDLWEELYTLIQQGVSQAESAQRLGLSRNVVQTAVNVGYAPNSRIFPGGRASIRDQLKADKLLTRAEATEYLSAAKEGEDGAASGDRYEQLIQSMDDCLDDVMLSRRDAGVGAIFAPSHRVVALRAKMAPTPASRLDNMTSSRQSSMLWISCS